MPEISRFFGIIVQMCYSDHDPPHFHVRYSGQKALIAIEALALLRGRLSPRALGLVTEWAAMQRVELMEDWNLARSEAQLKPIAPLE
jgi:phosphomannomutase